MYKIGTASGHADLLNQLNTFLTATGSAFGVTRAGAGDGRLVDYMGGADSVVEQYTLTATSSTQFSVVGSVTGNIGVATVGVPFVSSTLAFTIAAGGVAFSAGDKFTLATAPAWQAMRAAAGSEYVWKAPGNDGQQSIYVGMQSYVDAASDVYNLRCGGFTGFDAGLPFFAQPGGLPYALPNTFGNPGLGLWTNSIPYWFVADGRRVVVIAKVSTVYQAAYLGFFEPYVDPGAYPYPLVVGGTVVDGVRWSNTTQNNSCFAIPQYTYGTYSGQLYVRKPDGGWQPFYSNTEPSVWPYVGGFSQLRQNLDGSYPLLPVTLCNYSPLDIYGRLGGIHATSGFGTGAEARISEGQLEHLVVQNVFRANPTDYFTLALD